MNKRVTLSEQKANDLVAVALMANEVVASAKKNKGRYVLVSRRKLKALKQALEQLGAGNQAG